MEQTLTSRMQQGRHLSTKPQMCFLVGYAGYKAQAELLLRNGADPNIQDGDGRTPLHIAFTKSNEILARILLGNGANPDIADKEGVAAWIDLD